MKVIVVAGMHRSGTSLVARTLNLLGADLGPSSSLLPAAPDNPSGFWEHRDVKELNDRLLASLGGTWDAPPPLPAGWQDSRDLNPVRSLAAAIVAQFSDSDVVCWKDPRFSLTLPFWRTVIPVDVVVLCLRSPRDVARSLAIRNGLAEEDSADLWLRYTLSAWSDSPDRLTVDYQDALADPLVLARQLTEQVDLPDPTDKQLEAVSSFVTPGPDGRASTGHGSARMALAEHVYELLTEPGTPRTAAVLAELAQPWYLSPPGEEAAQLATLISKHARLEDRCGALQAAVERRDALAAGNRRGIDRLRLERRRLAHQLKETRTDLTTTRSELRAAQAEQLTTRDELTRRVRDVTAEVGRLEKKLEQREADIASLTSSVRRLREGADADANVIAALKSDVRRLRAQRRKYAIRYREIKNSRSVRIALLVASLPTWLRRLRPRKHPGLSLDNDHPRHEPCSGGSESDDDAFSDPKVISRGVRCITGEIIDRLNDRPVAVLVPVHNAFDDFRRCFSSLVRNTTREAELIVIDDCSTDPRISDFLDEVVCHERVRVIRNQTNLGFAASVNVGIRASEGDVVVLNSDTEVPPRWLESIILAGALSEDIGTVTAISDNAGAFSVPEVGCRNPLPACYETDELGRLLRRWSLKLGPSTPTGNGFCMYVKRRMLDEIGLFDEATFGDGYGEENDLSLRGAQAGWRHVIDDATFVRHRRGASFGDRRDALISRARALLESGYPDYSEAMREFVASPDMGRTRQRARQLLAWAATDAPRIRVRVLFAVHAGSGGTPYTTRDLLESFDETFECFVLSSDTKRVVFTRHGLDGEEELAALMLDSPLELTDFSHPDYREFVAMLLDEWDIDLIHVRHLIKHTLDLPFVGRMMGVPIVLSLHDYYYCCPTVHLVDGHGSFCRGICTREGDNCYFPNPRLQRAPALLKDDWLRKWRSQTWQVLEASAAIVTASTDARDVYLSSFPELEATKIRIIEHGRDIEQIELPAPGPTPGETIRILVPGNLDVHKGINFIRELRALDNGNRLEFHLLGSVPERYRDLGVWHGAYEREKFPDHVRTIAPAFVGLFSITAETYSHVLTEAWACGIPVICSDLGALGERTRRHGRGWTIDVNDPVAAYKQILSIADDLDSYWSVRRAVTAADLPTQADMAFEYERLYKSVLDGRRQFKRQVPHQLDRNETLSAELVVLGDAEKKLHPGSVHVRALLRYKHPSLTRRLTCRVSDTETFLQRAKHADLVVVERTAVAAERLDAFIRICDEAALPLIVDLDDYLVDLEHSSMLPGYQPHQAIALEQLLKAADLVTVSTQRLLDALTGRAAATELVPNLIDEGLWLTESTSTTAITDQIRILYMGTKTHNRDLALLRTVIPEVAKRIPGGVILEVVGGEPETTQGDWYSRLPIPADARNYPQFVRWLRSQRHRWQLAVAPLEDTEFNSFKSDLKFLEYSALGLAGVYSRVPAYENTVRDGETGVLAENAQEEWVERLVGLCQQRPSRDRIAHAAHEYVTGQRRLGLQADRFMELLQRTASVGRRTRYAERSSSTNGLPRVPASS